MNKNNNKEILDNSNVLGEGTSTIVNDSVNERCDLSNQDETVNIRDDNVESFDDISLSGDSSGNESINSNGDLDESCELSSNCSNNINDNDASDIEWNDDYSNDDNDNSKFDYMLYKNSTMSVDQGVLELMNFYINHKLTKAALKEMLRIVCNMLPRDNQMPRTVFKLFQYVKNIAPPCNVNKHFYCKKCLHYIGCINDKIFKCSSCNANKNDISFFFEFDIHDQVKYMFENRNLATKLKSAPTLLRDENIISDITDGSEYIRVNSRDNRHKYDLTLILNTDGLSLVKSAKSHCWPLMFTIAELPEHLRESFIVTVGLWYDDDCKPSMNTFLRPFCLKFKKYFEDGIHWVDQTTGENITSRIVAPLIIADAPARAQIQNILNFNGHYGCNMCEIRTKQCQRVVRKKSCRIYPLKDNVTLRTGARMEQQARRVLKSNKIHIKGVKGYSVISCLPLVDLGTCVLPEYMHSVLLGVVKHFITIWLKRSGPWNIKQFSKEIDTFLVNIRPLQSFSRLPRPISQFQFYKASEYYNWILFYSLPALVNYLPDKYFQHWMLIVIALYTLLQERITIIDLQQADELIKLFREGIPTLYSDRDLTYNAHQLAHLVQSVKRWGPLWATSAFPFENYNGFIANCVHGNKHMGQEIVHILTIAQGVQVLKNRVTADEHDTNVEDHELKKYQLLGKNVTVDLNDVERQLLLSKGLYSMDDVKVYTRAKINKEIYTSNSYKITKTNSYTVQIKMHNNSYIYGEIRFFFEIQNKLCFIIQCFSVKCTKMFYENKTKAKVKHIIPVQKNSEFLLIKLESIKSIIQVLKVGEYICKRPNLFRKIW